mgnify:CR=1 FL=1
MDATSVTTTLSDSTSAVSNVASLVDFAAKKPDRWWFMTLLMVGMSWSAFLWYHADQELQKRDARIDGLQSKIFDILQTVVNHHENQLKQNTEMLIRVEHALKSNN